MTIRIVVCDDEPPVRTSYTTILDSQNDMEVVGQAANGSDAVRVGRDLRPDVVVMDIRMPVLDGIEATRRLAGNTVADPVRVLIVTNFHLDEYVYWALRAGASGFLLKDAPPSALIAAVRTVAGGGALLAPAVTLRLIESFAVRLTPPDGCAPALELLTDREVEILKLVGRGLANAEIAEHLVISPETVKTHVSAVLTKLDLRDRAQAVVLAYDMGIIG